MRFNLCAVLLVVGLSGAAQAVPITYDINRIVDGGSVIGTITTDGTIGTLATANVTSWSFTVFDGIASFLFDGDENFVIFGTAVSATVGGLFFNFDHPTSSTMRWDEDIGSNRWIYSLSLGTTDGSGLEQISHIGFPGAAQQFTRPTGTVLFASAQTTIPEPAILALLPLGLGVMTLARRRKRR